MLRAIQISAPVEQQTAIANSAANGPDGAGAMEYSAEVSTNSAPTFLQQQQQSQEKAAEPAEMEEFNVFRDYFGLINLVKSFVNVPDNLASPPSDYSTEGEVRERRDSLGSAGSEFSSSNSAESIEVADIYYTAYGHDILGMKQAFMDPVGEEGFKMASLPTSLLLEHKIITSAAAKKPQVCEVRKWWCLFVTSCKIANLSPLLCIYAISISLSFFLAHSCFGESPEGQNN